MGLPTSHTPGASPDLSEQCLLRQLGCSVCMVSKQGDLDVGIPFIFHLGKEQKTLPTAELSFVSPL